MSFKRKITVFIPGNPGDTVLFDYFLSLIDEEIFIWAHLPLNNRPENMLPYAIHQVEKIKNLIKERGDSLEETEIVIVGYSVGSYIAHLIVAEALLPIAKVIFLFPFLVYPTPPAVRYLNLCASPLLYKNAVRFYRRLPKPRAMQILERSGVQELKIRNALDNSLRSASAHSYFAMAAAEKREIATQNSCEYLLSIPFFQDPLRFHCLFATNDRWVPSHLEEALAPFTQHPPAPVSHDFILDPKACQEVALRLNDILQTPPVST